MSLLNSLSFPTCCESYYERSIEVVGGGVKASEAAIFISLSRDCNYYAWPLSLFLLRITDCIFAQPWASVTHFAFHWIEQWFTLQDTDLSHNVHTHRIHILLLLLLLLKSQKRSTRTIPIAIEALENIGWYFRRIPEKSTIRNVRKFFLLVLYTQAVRYKNINLMFSFGIECSH